MDATSQRTRLDSNLQLVAVLSVMLGVTSLSLAGILKPATGAVQLELLDSEYEISAADSLPMVLQVFNAGADPIHLLEIDADMGCRAAFEIEELPLQIEPGETKSISLSLFMQSGWLCPLDESVHQPDLRLMAIYRVGEDSMRLVQEQSFQPTFRRRVTFDRQELFIQPSLLGSNGLPDGMQIRSECPEDYEIQRSEIVGKCADSFRIRFTKTGQNSAINLVSLAKRPKKIEETFLLSVATDSSGNEFASMLPLTLVEEPPVGVTPKAIIHDRSREVPRHIRLSSNFSEIESLELIGASKTYFDAAIEINRSSASGFLTPRSERDGTKPADALPELIEFQVVTRDRAKHIVSIQLVDGDADK